MLCTVTKVDVCAFPWHLKFLNSVKFVLDGGEGGGIEYVIMVFLLKVFAQKGWEHFCRLGHSFNHSSPSVYMLPRKTEYLCDRLEEGKLGTVPWSPDTKGLGPPQLINRCVLVPSQAQPLMAKQGPNNCEELKAKYWLYLLSNKRAMKLI